MAERMSAMKGPGESDMDFYERRYQEKVRQQIAHTQGKGGLWVFLLKINLFCLN